MKTIVFIFHEATHTGAPLLLYRFLQFLKKQNQHWNIQVLFQKPGILVDEVKRLFPVTVLNIHPGISFPQRLNTFLRKKNNRHKLKSLFKKPVGIIYSNTIANGLLLDEIKALSNAKVLLHVHELSLIIEEFGSINNAMNVKYANAIIFNSKLTEKSWKVKNPVSIPSVVIYPFMNEFAESTCNDTMDNKEQLIIGGCGNFTWRKGLESFLFVAKEICLLRDDVIFKWVGGDESSLEFSRLHFLLKKLHLQEKVEFIAAAKEPSLHFKTFSLLFVSSYEEPFSMVAAECAALRIPLVCYENCTGASELFVPDAGIEAPLGLHHIAAKKIVNLLDDKERRGEMGKAAQKIARERASLEKNASQMLNFITEIIEE